MADHYRTLDDLDAAVKRMLGRADLNVPIRDGRITDRLRIDRQAPTIREPASKPKRERMPEISLRSVAPALAKTIGRKVVVADDCIGDVTKAAASMLKDGDVLSLENLRDASSPIDGMYSFEDLNRAASVVFAGGCNRDPVVGVS